MLSFGDVEEIDEAELDESPSPSSGGGYTKGTPPMLCLRVGADKKRQRVGMNPNVATDFLPDHEREVEEAKLREELKEEWKREQERIKSQLLLFLSYSAVSAITRSLALIPLCCAILEEKLEITYSYWDGSGHRRAITVPKRHNGGQVFGVGT